MCHKIFSKLQGLLKARGQHFQTLPWNKVWFQKKKKNAGITPMKAAMLRNTKYTQRLKFTHWSVHYIKLQITWANIMHGSNPNFNESYYTENFNESYYTEQYTWKNTVDDPTKHRLYYGSIWHKTGTAQNLLAKTSILNSSKSYLSVFEPILRQGCNIQIQHYSFTHATLLNIQNAGCYKVWVK